MKRILLTISGKDKPGIIAKVTGILFARGCNLEDVSMTLLEGQFAMMMTVCVPSQKALDGNSIAAGSLASDSAHSWGGLGHVDNGGIVGTANPTWCTKNNGNSGYTTPMVDAYSAGHTDPLCNPGRPKNAVLFLEVLNDYLSGSSVAQCIAHMTTYVTNRHAAGWKVVGITPPPYSPTLLFPEADRQAIIAAMKVGTCGFDAICDAGSDASWFSAPLVLNAAVYNADMKHPNDAGHALIATYAIATLAAM